MPNRSLIAVLSTLALLGALAGGAIARTIYVAIPSGGPSGAGGVSAIDSLTNRALDVPNGDDMIASGPAPHAVAITPDGRFAYVADRGGTGNSGGVSVIDLATKIAIEVPDFNKLIKVGKNPLGIAITPDGRFAYVANQGGGVSVIDTSTNEAIEVPDGNRLINTPGAFAIAITPDGKFAYVASVGGVAVIDTSTNQAIEVPDGKKLIKAGDSPRGIAITPDGRFAYVADEAGGSVTSGVTVIDTATNRAIEVPDGNKLVKVGAAPVAVAITPSGRFAYVANAAGGVSVIDTSTNQAIEVPDGNKLIKGMASPVAVAIRPDGRFAYVADEAGADVAVIDTSTNRVIEVPDENKRIKVGRFPHGIALSPDGRFAFVADEGSGGVSLIDTAINKATEVPDADRLIKAGDGATAVAITPNGRFAYVANQGGIGGVGEGISVIDTSTNRAIEVPDGKKMIKVGSDPVAVAITPDGRFAYVADEGRAGGTSGVSVIDTSTNEAIDVGGGNKLIPVGGEPSGVAITPDGKFAYVTRSLGGVAVIDTASKEVIEVPDGGRLIKVGTRPTGIAITPDGRFAYVTDEGETFDPSGSGVSVIDTSTNQAIEVPDGNKLVKVGAAPIGVAISPDGRFAYIGNGFAGVSVIDTSTNQAIEVPDGNKLIKAGNNPEAVALSPDGRFVYVANLNSTGVSVIDTAANQAIEVPDGKVISLSNGPIAVAVTPDRPPTASFTNQRARPGVPVTFDASGSKDPDSAIATYAWSFSDGGNETLPNPTTTRTFARPGTYNVSLKETDAEGCSTPDTFLFTGQTAYCGGNAAAALTRRITVAYPGVGLRCPKRARARGCAFKLQVVARKPKKGHRPTIESAVARAKLKAGRGRIVSLKAKKRFAKALASAQRVLVRETARIGRSTRTRYLRLKIVQ